MKTAVIPAYNEGTTIGSVVHRTQPFVDRVIVIDDGSTDDTATVAQRAGADVFSHQENTGKGAAVRTGLSVTDAEEGDKVALLDGDGQHDPSALPKAFSLLEDDVDIVVGSREIQGDGTMPHYRRFGRSLLDSLTNFFAGGDVSDTQSGFRVVDGAVVDDILPYGDDIGVESEMLLHAKHAGLVVEEFQIENHYPSEAETSMNPIRHGLVVFRSILRTVRGQYPLATFGTIGVLCLVIGFILGYNTATHYYATREFWPGKAMLSMLFSIIGTHFLVGAVILDYLSILRSDHPSIEQP